MTILVKNAAVCGAPGCGLMTGCSISPGGGAGAVGISAAGIAGGYIAGNALDKHWTAIEIVP